MSFRLSKRVATARKLLELGKAALGVPTLIPPRRPRESRDTDADRWPDGSDAVLFALRWALWRCDRQGPATGMDIKWCDRLVHGLTARLYLQRATVMSPPGTAVAFAMRLGHLGEEAKDMVTGAATLSGVCASPFQVPGGCMPPRRTTVA